MSKKSMSNFKQKLKENKTVAAVVKTEEYIYRPSNIVNLEEGEKIIRLDKGTIKISFQEIKDLVQDLFTIKKTLSPGEKINLYNISDYMFNLEVESVSMLGEKNLFMLKAI